MTKRMVGSSQLGKIARQEGPNKQADFLDLSNEQAKNLRAGCQKNLENLSEHALLLGTSE